MKFYRHRRRIDYWYAASKIKNAIPDLKNSNIPNDYIESYLKGTNMEFFEEEKKPVPVWIRFTFPFFLIFIIWLLITAPLYFFFTGKWGYDLDWVYNWQKSLGL